MAKKIVTKTKASKKSIKKVASPNKIKVAGVIYEKVPPQIKFEGKIYNLAVK